MRNIIEFRKFRKRKKLQNFLRFLMIISVAIMMGVFAYASIIMKRDHPIRLPSYVEFKAG